MKPPGGEQGAGVTMVTQEHSAASGPPIGAERRARRVAGVPMVTHRHVSEPEGTAKRDGAPEHLEVDAGFMPKWQRGARRPNAAWTTQSRRRYMGAVTGGIPP
eukprot:7032330-Heterocapsa_arctica.AAC.1